MNILNKIKKKWDFSKSVKQNAIYFNTSENQEKKARKKMLFSALIIIAIAMFFNNPLLGLAMLIGTISYGSEYVYNSGNSNNNVVTMLDATHFVVAYTDFTNSSYGTAVVGVVSGSAISYGSEYVFNSASTSQIGIDALDATHFVVAYRDVGNSDYGTSIVGVVSSGNVISYGSEVVYKSAECSSNGVCVLDSTHFVVTYTVLFAGTSIVGVVSSGDTITFGTEVVWDATNIYIAACCALDSTHFVVAGNDNSNSLRLISYVGVVSSGDTITFGSSAFADNEAAQFDLSMAKLDTTHFVISHRISSGSVGKAIVGAVANGNELSYGSVYTFHNATTYKPSITALDSTHIIISYADGSNAEKGTSVVGTISGSEITFGDEYIYNNAATDFVGVNYLDSTHFVVVYKDSANSGYGTAIIGTYTPPAVSEDNSIFFGCNF